MTFLKKKSNKLNSQTMHAQIQAKWKAWTLTINNVILCVKSVVKLSIWPYLFQKWLTTLDDKKDTDLFFTLLCKYKKLLCWVILLPIPQISPWECQSVWGGYTSRWSCCCWTPDWPHSLHCSSHQYHLMEINVYYIVTVSLYVYMSNLLLTINK